MAGRPQGGDDWYAEHAASCAFGAQVVGGPDGRLEAQGEASLARAALDAGDLRHAAHHVARAFQTEPRLPEAHEALSRLAARAGGAEAALDYFEEAAHGDASRTHAPDRRDGPAVLGSSLLSPPVLEPPVLGATACRAHLFASLGRWDEALRTLSGAIAAEPHRPWAHAAWLARPDLPGLLGADSVYRAVAAVASALEEPLPRDARQPVRPFYDLVRAVVAQHRDEPGLLAVASGLARRFDDLEDAVDWAARARGLAPGYLPSVMLGYALRAAGQHDEAIGVWTAQVEQDPSDLALHVDIAELYAATGRPRQALPWVERALATDPRHEKAGAVAHGIRYAIDGDASHLVALADHLREHPGHQYAATVLAVHCAGKPWLGRVHYASEATVNVLHQVLEARRPAEEQPEGDVNVSMIEPPSAVLALRTAMPSVRVAFQSVGDPDPRLPGPELGEGGLRVWRYTELDAEAAVPPPSARAADRARAVAQLNWLHLPAAYDRAVALSDLPVEDLVGLLAHPPVPREDEQGRFLAARFPDLWIRAVQTFACLGIAHYRADEPWPDSTRRAVLLDLLSGPEDWVCEAAAAALVAVAWTQPETRCDIGRAVARRMTGLAQAYETREVTILESLCLLTLACPWLDAETEDMAREVLKALTPPPDDEEDRAAHGSGTLNGKGRGRDVSQN